MSEILHSMSGIDVYSEFEWKESKISPHTQFKIFRCKFSEDNKFINDFLGEIELCVHMSFSSKKPYFRLKFKNTSKSDYSIGDSKIIFQYNSEIVRHCGSVVSMIEVCKLYEKMLIRDLI